MEETARGQNEWQICCRRILNPSKLNVFLEIVVYFMRLVGMSRSF